MFDKLIDPATFEFFAKYVLSGYTIILVTNAYVSGQKPKPAEMVLEIVLFSLINQLIWTGIANLSSALWVLLPAPVGSFMVPAGVAFYLQVLVLPICIGALAGWSQRRGIKRFFYRVLSLPLVDPYPRAYDHVFANFKGQAFVVIAFQDGANVFGLYGYDSRASRDPDRSEVYLEALYDVDEEGVWSLIEPKKSALISLRDVRAIEFLPVKENDSGTETDR